MDVTEGEGASALGSGPPPEAAEPGATPALGPRRGAWLTGAILLVAVVASAVATLAWIPGGLGALEGSCVAMLRLLDTPVEAALAATLLLRGFTFWLPMIPGLWLARREVVRPVAGSA